MLENGIFKEVLTIYRVNAFTGHLFKGNPAGVCITEQALSDELMKNIAMEMAVSETAFVSLHDMTLRWFTPMREVSLCGHATLSAAYILYNQMGFAKTSPVTFQTISGPLVVHCSGGLIEMEFPRIDVIETKADRDILGALGLHDDDIVFEGLAGKKHLLHVKDEQIVNSLSVDFAKLLTRSGRGIIITSDSKDPYYDFVSRYFAPWVGVNEDPVTGSAHCVLMPYWYEKKDKAKMIAHQNSARGGEIIMELCGDRVKLSGKAVLALKGLLAIRQQ